MYAFPGEICNTYWPYKTWQFYEAQYGDYILAQNYVISFKILDNTNIINKINIPPYGYD